MVVWQNLQFPYKLPWIRFERNRKEGLNLNSMKPSLLALESQNLHGEAL
jgi:hypothetical protein